MTISLERAGIIRPNTGMLGDRPLRLGKLALPKSVEVRNGKVIWEPGTGKGSKRRGLARQSAEGALDSFILLADGSETRIASFVQKFGVLEICEHEVFDQPASEHDAWRGCSPRRLRNGKVWEPVEYWSALAQNFRAVLDIAAQLINNSGFGRNEDWAKLRRASWNPDIPPSSKSRAKIELQNEVNDWLDAAGVRLGLRWGKRPQVYTEPGSRLLGVLVMQLLFAVTTSDGLAFCSYCGKHFKPKRKPREDQNSYCQKCGKRKRASWRLASRNYRNRKKSLQKGR